MSLQDDYFDLIADLDATDQKALNRIWAAFCLLETENIELRKAAPEPMRYNPNNPDTDW